MSQRVLVCGSRDFHDRALVSEVLQALTAGKGALTVIHGGARGADSLAAEWAASRPADIQEYVADWATYGKPAGPIRNQKMLDEGQPDLVIAFVHKPIEQSKGTYDMVNRAWEAGIKTVVVSAHPLPGVDDIWGIDPDFTGDRTTQEHMDELRGPV